MRRQRQDLDYEDEDVPKLTSHNTGRKPVTRSATAAQLGATKAPLKQSVLPFKRRRLDSTHFIGSEANDDLRLSDHVETAPTQDQLHIKPSSNKKSRASPAMIQSFFCSNNNKVELSKDQTENQSDDQAAPRSIRNCRSRKKVGKSPGGIACEEESLSENKRRISGKSPPLHDIRDIFEDAVSNPKTKEALLNAVKYFDGKPIRVATMCSGTESPLLALGLISDGKTFEASEVLIG